MKTIRPLYDKYGAEGFYRDHAADYSNPHFPEISALLQRNMSKFDCSGGVLDFACGGGEVTQVLQQSGIAKITGCDPYTCDLYERQTKNTCLRLSFKDLIKGTSIGHYSLIISSFALHLCPGKDLFPLTWRLFEAAPTLVVITPHKRPELEKIPGIALAWEDCVTTEKGKRVKMKVYRRRENLS